LYLIILSQMKITQSYKSFYIIGLLVSCLSYNSQNQLRLLSANGAVFKVYLNDKPYNKTPQAEVLVESIKKDTIQFKIEFETGNKYAATVFLLNKGQSTFHTEFNYNLDVVNNKLKLRFMGSYPIQTLPNPLVPKLQTSVPSKTQVAVKQASVEPSKVLNCKDSLDSQKMEDIIQLLKKEQDDGNRQIVLKNNLMNNCFSIHQVRQQAEAFTHDREKLKALLNLYQNSLNKAGFYTLSTCLTEEVYKSQLFDFIKKQESGLK